MRNDESAPSRSGLLRGDRHPRQGWRWLTGSRSRVSMFLVPAVVLGTFMSGAALPASAVDPAPVVATADPAGPTDPDLSKIDPTQTTVPSDPVETPTTVPEEPAPAETPVPNDDPTTGSPTVDPTQDPTQVPEPLTPLAEPDLLVQPEAAMEIAPALVPVPTGNDAVITVKVGGVRTTLTDVQGLAGVRLRLYDGGAAGPNATPLADAWATCVSDTSGDCSFTVPNTQIGGANRDRQFWIKQDVSAGNVPAGYFANTTLAVGTTPASATYQFRTGTRLRATETYRSTVEFMIASGTANNASGGIWQNSKANPVLPAKCGINVALVLDLSGSVSPYLANLKGAAKTFVDSLTGTPSAVALFTFASNAPASTGANLSLVPVSVAAGANTVKNRIDTYTAGGSTNWDRGLYQVAASPSAFDVAVVITDGNPTTYAANEGPGDRTRFREVENGIFSANSIKNEGTRIVAMGVGTGVGGAPDNLRAISGPTSSSDYYQTSDYAAAGAALRALALGNCEGSVSVVKQVVPSGNTGENITGAIPSAGWTFTASTTTPGVTPATQTGATQAGIGAVNFPLSYPGGTTSATMKIAETQQAGYTLVTQSGKRAVCTNVATGAPVTVTNDLTDPANLAFTVDAPATAAISCIVYNRAPQPQASITVDKQWVVNGTTYAEGNQPIGFNSQLTIGGTNQAWSVPRTSLIAGNTVEIGESTTITGRDLCTVTSSRITKQNGSNVDLPVPSTVTLNAGDANTYTVTNVVNCTSELTLLKSVTGGPADPASWTLAAVAPTGAIAGPSGASGVTGVVSSNVRYPLTETGGSNLYVQQIITGGAPIAPSTGSWECVQIDAQGAIIPGFNDGINGGVTLPLGYRVQCTAANQGATLTLIKQVVNDNGGSKTPADWSLTATPTGNPIPGVNAQSVAGSVAGSTIQVRPGTTYNLTESGPAGYDQTSLKCDSGPETAFTDATSVTVPALEDVTCVFVNDDQGATLTLVKEVDNGTTGSTSVATDWTLSAAGPTPISGLTGEATVTAANVSVGTYTLGEAGPAGYTASAWTCTDGTLTGSNLVLAGGDSATCTITNTANQPKLTLVKTVDNGLTQATAGPSAWNLAAAGPVTVSGAGNSPEVTGQSVPVGTYSLSESGGPAGYSASAWSCTGGVSATDSSVTLALGSDVTCTITNTAVAPTLTLVKEVTNTSGGTAVATDWLLAFAGPVSGSGVSGSVAVQNVTVPVGSYSLSESGGPTGYAASAWSCTAGVLTGDSLALGLGEDATCTLTNTDQPASLSLVKVVDPAMSGSLLRPVAWTLTATPVGISGQGVVSGNGTGVAALGGVRDQLVFAGQYTLSESGPAGFTAQSWSCPGGVVDGNVVTVPNGGNVECTITNVANTPKLTLVKVVDNDEGAGTSVVGDWTLSASGPTPIGGVTGAATVTAAEVMVGTYTLAESGPTGYDAGNWSCTGGLLTGADLTLTEGQDVTCTITNTAEEPTLTLVKVVDNGSTGSTAVPADWTLTATGGAAGTISGASGSGSVTQAPAKAATYTLSESGGPVGYTASAWTCVGATATTGSTVSLAAGDDATCTLTNTAQASTLTLVKEVDNGQTGATYVATDWVLSATGPISLSGATGAQTVTAATLPIGDYTLGENGPVGYTSSDWACDNENVTDGIVSIGLGQDVTCTVTNTAQPSTLTLHKVVQLTNGGSAVAGDWTLKAGDVLSGPDGVTATVPVGNYSLSELGGPAGYALTSLTCDNSTSTSVADPSVTVGLGQDVNCTFTNESQAAQLTLTKVVDDNGAGLNTPVSAWDLSATPSAPIAGQDPVTGAGGFAATNVKAGTYTLGETGPTGYTASDWTCTLSDGATLDGANLTLQPGADAQCQIINKAQTPKLTLIKTVTNTHNGNETTADFPLTAEGDLASIGGVSGDVAITGAAVPVGTYTLTELIGDPLAYRLDALTCVEGDTELSTSVQDPTVELELGEDVTCTFANVDVGAKLTLIKEIDPAETGSAITPADWTLTATPDGIAGQDAVSGNGTGTADGGVFEADVFMGNYTLSESGPAGFVAGEWVCEGGELVDGVVTVPGGGNVICRITNTATSPHLTLVKVVENGETGATTQASAWTLTAAGPTPISGVTGGTTVTSATVKVGTYALSESGGPTGYTASDWVCEGARYADGSVTLVEGADATCTITNTAQPPVWTVSKTSNPVTGSTVLPGDVITYTITINHISGVALEGVVLTDNLTDVLSHASLVGTFEPEIGSAVLVGNTVEWTPGPLTGTKTLRYSVRVADGAFGVTLRNVVTPPEGSTCEGVCESVLYTPAWSLRKVSDPATGSKVTQGQLVKYTLYARNTGPVPVTGATSIDDLSDVLDDATLVEPLDPALTYDPVTMKLTWAMPTLLVGAPEYEVSYSVKVKADAYKKELHNVVVPGTPGGDCLVEVQPQLSLDELPVVGEPSLCETIDTTTLVDLHVEKAHAAVPDGFVDSGQEQVVDYSVTVTNTGDDPAHTVTMTDPLPSSLTFVDGTLVTPDGWTAQIVDGVLTASYAGDFMPGAEAVFTYSAMVGDVPRESANGAYIDVVNTACVSTSDSDPDMADNCATDDVPVKSVAVKAKAVCVNDAALATYSVTPIHVSGTPEISLIWWTKEAYAKRDQSIPAGDTAALLADGAAKVDSVPVPAGWVDGQTITGTQLWPGMAVDAAGNATAWPGWTKRANGSWVLDPAAPFYALRGETVMEIRVNPSTAATIIYPPATPDCNPYPPKTVPPVITVVSGGSGSTLSRTGIDVTSAVLVGSGLLIIGALLSAGGWRRRRGETNTGRSGR